MKHQNILILLSSLFLMGCTQEKTKGFEDFAPRVQGVSIAMKNDREMLQFYSSVFKVSFSQVIVHQDTIYTGYIGETSITLAPISITNVDARDNQIQLDVLVNSIEETLKFSNNNHGRTLNEPLLSDGFKVASLDDPDGNSIVIKQALNIPNSTGKKLFGFHRANSLFQ